jgi:hypothetical protein
VEIPTPWHDPWRAIEETGIAYQQFTVENRHEPRKAALGLPRKIHGPQQEPMGHQRRENHRQPIFLECDRGRRHASPAFFHVGTGPAGLTIRLLAFPSPHLRNLAESREVLRELLAAMKAAIKRRVANAPTDRAPSRVARLSEVRSAAPTPQLETWKGATLTFRPNDGSVSAASPDGARRAQASLKALVDAGTIDEAARARLVGKKRSATADVEVRVTGRHLEIVRVGRHG